MMAFFKKFTAQDLLYIALLSALGLVIKPIVTPLVHLISTPLMVPGGSLAGGFYMLWIVLAIVIIGKFGTGILVGLTQAIVIISLGYFGNHGVVSILSYTLPGVAADIVYLFYKRADLVYLHILLCVVANLAGTLVVTLLIMRLATIPLIIASITAIIAGIIGGYLSFAIYKKLLHYKLIRAN